MCNDVHDINCTPYSQHLWIWDFLRDSTRGHKKTKNRPRQKLTQRTISRVKFDEKSIKSGLEVEKFFLFRQNERSFRGISSKVMTFENWHSECRSTGQVFWHVTWTWHWASAFFLSQMSEATLFSTNSNRSSEHLFTKWSRVSCIMQEVRLCYQSSYYLSINFNVTWM